MTEQEYIECADLRTIRHAISNLREVLPENNPHVPAAEYRTVMRLLHEWQDALFRAVSIDPQEPTT